MGKARASQVGAGAEIHSPPGPFCDSSGAPVCVPGPVPALCTHATESLSLPLPRGQSSDLGRQVTRNQEMCALVLGFKLWREE